MRSPSPLFIFPLWVALSLSWSTSFAQADDPKALYLGDDRVELHESTPIMQQAAKSVSAFFLQKSLTRAREGIWQLPETPTGKDKGWCDNERFSNQPATASCTGFLIGPNLLATAAHCVQPIDDPGAPGLRCDSLAVVFGYQVDENENAVTLLSNEQVYQCEKKIAPVGNTGNADWLVLKLDRTVSGYEPLAVYVDKELNPDWNFEAIGYPSGLALKVATKGKLLTDEASDYFVTNLDTYAGNSGSPVLVTSQGKPMVVGILSQGAYDFVDSNGCQRSRRCDASCQGELVTRSNFLAPYAVDQVTRNMLK